MKFKSKDEKQRFLNKLLNEGKEAAIAEYMAGQLIPILKGQNIELFGETLTPDEVKQRYPGVLIAQCNDTETINHIKALKDEV